MKTKMIKFDKPIPCKTIMESGRISEDQLIGFGIIERDSNKKNKGSKIQKRVSNGPYFTLSVETPYCLTKII